MLDEKRLAELQEYIDRHTEVLEFKLYESASYSDNSLTDSIQSGDLEDFIHKARQPKFNQVLFNFIDKKGISDSDVYKRAGIDRRHFSKIRSIPDYKLGKNTVITLAMTLELNELEFNKLLRAAGYSLSESDTFDLVIQFCLENKIYKLQDVNQALDCLSLKPLAKV
jgi:hypothetical protein